MLPTLACTFCSAESGALHRLLDVLHLLRDVLGRLRGLAGKLLDAARHHGEALARVAGVHRLDAGVEGKQRGLPRHGLDQRHHLADARPGKRKSAHRLVGACEIGHGAVACAARDADVSRGSLDAGENETGGGEALATLTCICRLRWARSAAVLPMRSLPAAKASVTSSTAARKRRVKKLRPAQCSRASASRRH
jgi:hypothetical protein